MDSTKSKRNQGLGLLTVLLLAVAGCSSPAKDDAPSGPAPGDEQDLTNAPPLGPATPGAPLVKFLLAKTGSKAIVCKKIGSPAATIRIEKGWNAEDRTGLVVKGDYSYGTDEIGELFARDNLLVEWGEESNYHLTIPKFAWQLFGYDGRTTQPKFDAQAKALGTVVSEQETIDKVECHVEK